MFIEEYSGIYSLTVMLTLPRRNNKENLFLNVVFIFLIFSQPSVCSVWMMCSIILFPS